ncbi:trigger factor [Campylobacter sp. MIT 97-5078]|uniref:trigger factor n=1 Tax=Campylobacter sp. MIT 97-5078 TaxID=1548153 RepID=UPI000512ACFE|nr:trigger factor [Campylobacter sp. MIT 97-5078]KGI55844.1 trigger factor [Campylobacter sp. MIT 97-5078]KGI56840.1 trigger factor [Campylobacter sp. MIT 97-5078]TQR25617.1 trigger factor [Campylobacter sp. MIT 97-5078]
MEVKAKQLDKANANISVKIDSKSLEDEMQKLAQKTAKTIKMDGFRPGKVPASAVLKRYGEQLKTDAQQELLKQAMNTGLKELKKESKDIVGEPYFEKFDNKEGAVEADLMISFKPEIKLDGYEELIPKQSTPKITKKEIENKKEEMLKNFATHEEIKEKRGLKEGDFAKFDFEGFVDDKAFEGGKAENFTLEIGSKQFIPGFEEAMIDMKAGEEKDIKVTFPKDYGAANLAGKEAVFKIKLHEILKAVPAKIDEELLKKLLPNEKELSEEKLDEKLKNQLEQEKLYTLINEELKPALAEALVKKYTFDLPKGVVEQEIDLQLRNSLSNLSQDEIKALQEDKDKLKAKREEFKDEAQKSVKLTFIINELALLRKIGVSDQEVMQAVYFEAYRSGVDPRVLLQNYQQQGILPAVKMALVEEKLFNDIFMPKNEKKEPKKEKEESKKDKNEGEK